MTTGEGGMVNINSSSLLARIVESFGIGVVTAGVQVV